MASMQKEQLLYAASTPLQGKENKGMPESYVPYFVRSGARCQPPVAGCFDAIAF